MIFSPVANLMHHPLYCVCVLCSSNRMSAEKCFSNVIPHERLLSKMLARQTLQVAHCFLFFIIESTTSQDTSDNCGIT